MIPLEAETLSLGSHAENLKTLLTILWLQSVEKYVCKIVNPSPCTTIFSTIVLITSVYFHAQRLKHKKIGGGEPFKITSPGAPVTLNPALSQSQMIITSKLMNESQSKNLNCAQYT